MSKLNQIQNELLTKGQGEFQKLGDSYLAKKYPYSEIIPIGSTVGKDKTRTGTPDSLFKLTNGRFLFIEYTTQETGLGKKFLKDLEKCFDEEKTNIPLSEVEKIILACNGELTKDEKIELIKQCQEKNCNLEFVEIGTLSHDLYEKYPQLAKDFLGIECETFQILPLSVFIEEYQKNQFATPLDNQFFFREKELEQIHQSLDKGDLVILQGKAGVGKTKIALEAMSNFAEANPEYQVFCISNKALDLYEDLKAYFSPDGHYLILVDDANRLSQLPHILRLLHEQTENRRMKIILTVRDYAVDKVRLDSKNYFHEEIELHRFNDDEIKKILSEGFGIKNHEYLDRICDISQGNARIAVMAGKIALEANRLDSINNVEKIYDEFFSTIANDPDLSELQNKKLLCVAGILAFFRVIDKSQTEQFEKISNSFGFTADEFWTELEKLHEKEIADIYENEVAKISDQILGTYLFYKVFIRENLLDFSILLNEFFETRPYRMIESLNPIFDAFDSKFITEKLQPHVDRKWEIIKDDEEKVFSFLEVFYYHKTTEALRYIKSKIDLLDKVEVDESELSFAILDNLSSRDRYLEVLKLFYGDELPITLDIVFDYLEKNPRIISQVIYLLTKNFSYKHYSYKWNYWVQKNVVSKLLERAKSEKGHIFKKLTVTVAKKYLGMHFDSHDSKTPMTVTIRRFNLEPYESLFEMRQSLWKFLFDLYDKDICRNEISEIIKVYSSTWHKDYIVEEIVKNDAEVILPFIESLDKQDYQNCVLAYNYLEFLRKVGIDFDKSLKSKLQNKAFKLSRVLFENERRELKMEWREYEEYKKNLLKKYFASCKYEDYKEFFELCKEILNHQNETRDFYQFSTAVGTVLTNLADENSELFIQVIEHVLQTGNQIGFDGRYIVHRILEKTDNPKFIYELIQKNDFIGKTNWLFSFFISLDEKDIDEFYLKELYNLYQTVNLREISQNLDYLEKYSKVEKEVYLNIVRVLFERVKKGEGDFNFHYLFNPYSEDFKHLEENFSENISLLKEIFFYQVGIDNHCDHDGMVSEKIFDLDESFLKEYIDVLSEQEDYFRILHNSSINFAFVWKKENYDEKLGELFNYIQEKEKDNWRIFGSTFGELFFRNIKDDETKEKSINFIKRFIEENAQNADLMSFIFKIIATTMKDKIKDFLEIFLRRNRNLEDFKRLSFEPSFGVSWTGSAVPVYEEKVNFYDSLLSLFNSADLLEHRLILEDKKKYYREEVERHKKKDFIGHY
jgi:hypothetical protein